MNIKEVVEQIKMAVNHFSAAYKEAPKLEELPDANLAPNHLAIKDSEGGEWIVTVRKSMREVE